MLNHQEMDSWERDGFVRLGRMANDSQLRDLQDRIDDLMMGRIPTDGIWFQLDSESGDYGDLQFGDGCWAGRTLNYRKIERLENDPLFLAYIRNPRFREITRELIGEEVSIYRAMFMNKPAGRGTHLPYHQDGGSQWQLSLDPFVTIWTALDDATRENGCMQVIPGSHKLGLLSDEGHTISPDQEARHCGEESSVYLEANAGEAILLHNLLLHRSGINTIDQPRRAFSVCYMDAATEDTSSRNRIFPVVFGNDRRGQNRH